MNVNLIIRTFMLIVLVPIISTLSVITSSTEVSAADKKVSVIVNGETLIFGQQAAIIKNGATLVPMRDIFTSLGADIKWDNTTKTVTGTKGDNTIILTVGQKTALKNGVSFPLQEPAIVIKGTTLVPVRFIADSLGADVQWDKNTLTVTIKDEEFKIKEIQALSAKEQETLLSRAVSNNDLKQVEFLLKNISYTENAKGEELLLAISYNRTDIVKYFVENNHIDLNKEIDIGQGYTTLPLIQATLTHTITFKDSDGNKSTIVNDFNEELIEYFVLAGAKPDPDTLKYAIVRGKIDTVKFLLDHGADPNARDKLNQRPMVYWAIDWGHEDIRLLLIEYGAEPTPLS